MYVHCALTVNQNFGFLGLYYIFYIKVTRTVTNFLKELLALEALVGQVVSSFCKQV